MAEKNGQADIAAALGCMPLFERLRPEERIRLAAGCRLKVFAKDAVLLREGDKADGLFFVRKGVVKMIGLSPEGREVVLHLIRPGNSLGEGAVFQRGTYPATAVAVNEVEAVYVSGETLISMMAENPDLALRMLAALSMRLRMFSRKLTAQSQGGAAKRLAAYLLHRSHLSGGDPLIRLGVSREVLAALLGVARETLSRKLSHMVEVGAISVHGKDIRIEKEELLRGMAERNE